MHGAAIGGHLEMVKFLSPLFGARAHEKDSLGLSILHYAAMNGHCQVARYLIEELKIDPMVQVMVCGCWRGGLNCVRSAASVYVLIVAN